MIRSLATSAAQAQSHCCHVRHFQLPDVMAFFFHVAVDGYAGLGLLFSYRIQPRYLPDVESQGLYAFGKKFARSDAKEFTWSRIHG
jgi:hypothetical protein